MMREAQRFIYLRTVQYQISVDTCGFPSLPQALLGGDGVRRFLLGEASGDRQTCG